MKTSSERQLRGLLIKNGFVKVSFINTITKEPTEGYQDSAVLVNEYHVKSKEVPHSNLTNSMTKLRKLCLKALGISVDAKTIGNWNVNALKISGDTFMHQSRVVATLELNIDWSGGKQEIDTPEITMYGDGKFKEVEDFTAIVEDIIAETWAYIDGDYENETGQLALFAFRAMNEQLALFDPNPVNEPQGRTATMVKNAKDEAAA